MSVRFAFSRLFPLPFLHTARTLRDACRNTAARARPHVDGGRGSIVNAIVLWSGTEDPSVEGHPAAQTHRDHDACDPVDLRTETSEVSSTGSGHQTADASPSSPQAAARKHRYIARDIVVLMSWLMIIGTALACAFDSAWTMIVVLFLPFSMLPLSLAHWIRANHLQRAADEQT
ncbi:MULTISPECIES: hypothetical protein [unclassified Xanthobacter]|uniref:hypothetical protein n=1 Tax=unclassified Xanthobacter TaxID=2623496 RepID=UPI001F21F942|nr:MULTISPECIES: hypothetical protein [unclassified Xanthobacter]